MTQNREKPNNRYKQFLVPGDAPLARKLTLRACNYLFGSNLIALHSESSYVYTGHDYSSIFRPIKSHVIV